MKRSRKRYSSKVKLRVALEALPKEATLDELASRHGDHAVQSAAWRKQAPEHLSEALEHGSHALEDAVRHIRDWRAKVRALMSGQNEKDRAGGSA